MRWNRSERRLVICMFCLSFLLGESKECGFRYGKTFVQGATSRPLQWRLTVENAVECAIACARMPDCRSYSLRAGPQGCGLYFNRTTLLHITDPSPPDMDTFYNLVTDSCPTEMGYVRVLGTQKCLRLKVDLKNWTQANQACEDEGGRLLAMEDMDTWQAVRTFLEDVVPASVVNIHTGGLKSSGGSWVWLDGRAVPNALWLPGEPNSDWRKDYCVSIWWEDRSNSFVLLDDAPCGWSRPYVCEYY